MTTAEAARRLGTQPGNIRGYITAGRLPAIRVDTPRGAIWDIDESDLALLGRRKYARASPTPRAKTPRQSATDANEFYTLPDDLLKHHHSLLDKRFESGLSDSEREELAVLSSQIDEADMMTPLEQRNEDVAASEHNRRMAVLDRVMELLGSF